MQWHQIGGLGHREGYCCGLNPHGAQVAAGTRLNGLSASDSGDTCKVPTRGGWGKGRTAPALMCRL